VAKRRRSSDALAVHPRAVAAPEIGDLEVVLSTADDRVSARQKRIVQRDGAVRTAADRDFVGVELHFLEGKTEPELHAGAS
jgi:hypothetical protein